MRSICTSIAAMLVLAGTTLAATINVPGDYTTIQEAIDASSDGDTVLIALGTYSEYGISAHGKAITISGETFGDGTLGVILSGSGGSYSATPFFQHGGPETVFENLMLTNHFGGNGGAFECATVGTTIRNCIIEGVKGSYGGAIFSTSTGGPIITDCFITGNCGESDSGSGGILSQGYPGTKYQPRVSNSVLCGNIFAHCCAICYRQIQGNWIDDGGNHIENGDCGTGICCTDNICTVVTYAECLVGGGDYLGIGDCSTGPCSPGGFHHEDFKLLASDGEVDDNFGCSVSISGKTAIIGACQEDENGSNAGAAYVYRYSEYQWVEEAKLIASDGADYDQFGSSVAIDGDAAIIGAWHDDENGSVSGSAYIYRYSNGAWAEEAKLAADDGGIEDRFGISVSISGNRAVIGAAPDDNGAAYVFRFDGTQWTQEQKLVSDEDDDAFGKAVSITGESILVGAKAAGEQSNGAAYIYHLDDGWWTQQAKLTASDGSAWDEYGISVSLNDGTAVVGSWQDGFKTIAGAAYVYRQDGSTWIEEAKLTASDAGPQDRFGCSVALSGENLVVGASGCDDTAPFAGAAYVYRFDGEQWQEQEKLLASMLEQSDNLGGAVAISKDVVLSAAYGDDDNGHNAAGAAYVYHVGPWTVDDDLLDYPDADFSSIQEAIDVANDGDEIIVYPGVYTETEDLVVDMSMKRISLVSVMGPDETIIDGCVYFPPDTPAGTLFSGFTVTNCPGAAIHCHGESTPARKCYATVTNCVITGNTAGITATYGGSSFTDCIISNNSGGGQGGGAQVSDWGGISFTNCVLDGNSASSRGGGAYIHNDSGMLFTNCTISNNSAPQGSALYIYVYAPFSGNATLVDTLVCGNTITGPWTDGGGNQFYGSCPTYGACCTLGACTSSLTESQCTETGGTWYEETDCEDVTCDQSVTVCPECYYSDIQSAIDVVPDGFTVNVEPGTYTSTQDGHVVDMKGKAVTLRASGTPEETILDGQGVRRVVKCSSGEGADTIIEGFTITGGSASTGGGIFCSSSSPTITECTISNNTATVDGGGIYCRDSSSPTITDCTISSNTAGGGGGIYCYLSSSPTITDCTITDNITIDDGGGIYCYESSNPTITGCTISGNTANDDGGGIFCAYSSSPTITNCTISDNTAASFGGGIGCYSSSPTINGCTIEGNTADYGGGLLLIDSAATVVDCTITSNAAVLNGGGVYCTGSSPTITNCVITENTAEQNGGGVWCENASSPNITGCVISGNTAMHGGGTYFDGGSEAAFSECLITGNTANLGGGVCCWNSSPEFTDCFIQDNTANTDGGGIYFAYSNPAITDCTITGNTANYRGGGIYCYQSSNPTITGCTILGNTADYGGGIYCYQSSNPTITDCTILGNTADYGGGIYCQTGNPTITGCTITNNTANVDGGGIYCYDSNPALGGTTVCGNTPDQINGTWTDNGGNWIADECIPVGACCIAGDCSESVTEADCASFGGDQWHEDTACADVTCLPVGGCCTQGTCVDDMYEADCLDGGGFWYEGDACSDITCSTTFTVPGDFSDIQSAIDAAGDGFEIIVAPGTYVATGSGDESVIDLKGKALWLHGATGAGDVILDGQGKRRVIDCPRADSGGEILIEGFTVTGGYLESGQGAGILIGSYALVVINNCQFQGNANQGFGGGVAIDSNGEATFNGCDVSYNTAYSGGGIHASQAWVTLTDCSVTYNTASSEGGGITAFAGSEVTLTNSILSDNSSANKGGGVYIQANSILRLTGCEVERNTASSLSAALHAFIYSDIYAQDTSFCKNIPLDVLVELGSEYFDEGGNVICPPDDECPGDTNGDGVVGVLDLLAVIDQWGVCDDECSADFNGDGTVGVTDLLIVLDAWGPCD